MSKVFNAWWTSLVVRQMARRSERVCEFRGSYTISWLAVILCVRIGYVPDDRHNLTEATREMVKKSTEDVKTLAAFPAGGPHVSCAASWKLKRQASSSHESADNFRHPASLYRTSSTKNTPMPFQPFSESRDCQPNVNGVMLNLRNGRLID
jgi:hypothetical protein